MTPDDSSHQQPGAAEPLGVLRAELLAAVRAVAADGAEDGGENGGQDGAARLHALLAADGPVTLERPRRAEFGDYSTNAALVLAPVLGGKPRELAESLGGALAERMLGELERFEVAGPGFLNLFLSDAWLTAALARVLAAGHGYGFGGPGAATGAGRIRVVQPDRADARRPRPQRRLWGRAGTHAGRLRPQRGAGVLRQRRRRPDPPLRGVGERRGAGPPAPGGRLPRGLRGRAGPVDPGRKGAATRQRWAGWRSPAWSQNTQEVLGAFGVQGFDHWTYESELYAGHPNLVERTLGALGRAGHTYTDDGALWLRSTEFGDDKDRVLVRSNGEHTYFASDIAYHQSRRARGYERQIDIWGADHHGYILRMKAAYAALGGDPEELELLIMQLVHLLRGGERAQMSKRAGEFVTLEELVREIGVDAARWYLLARSHDTTVDLDLDLARQQSAENPVYYVQYAHARIASIVARAGPARLQEALAGAATQPGPSFTPPSGR